MTKEDWIPQWARKAMLRDLPPQGEPPARLTARTCDLCNHSMGRVFENHTSILMRPMFRGHQVLLTERQQAMIAAWVIKTNLVRAVATDYGLSRFPTDHLEDHRMALLLMMQTGLPPPEATVRLGCAHPRITDLIEHPEDDRPFWIPPPYRWAFHTTAISNLHYLVWEVALGGGISSHEALRDVTQDDDRLIRIWPQKVPQQQWPPPVLFTPTAFSRLCEAWHHGPDAFGPSMTYVPRE